MATKSAIKKEYYKFCTSIYIHKHVAETKIYYFYPKINLLLYFYFNFNFERMFVKYIAIINE